MYLCQKSLNVFFLVELVEKTFLSEHDQFDSKSGYVDLILEEWSVPETP